MVNYDNRNVEIRTTGTGNIRTFVMPAHHVSVVAVFRLIGDVSSIVETDNYPSMIAYVQNGILYIGGLSHGEMWSVYDLTGRLINQGVAVGDRAVTRLPERGIYIVVSAESRIKIVHLGT